MTEPHNNDSNKRKDPPVSEDDDQESISDVDGEVYSEIQEELPHRPAFDQGLKMINETAKDSLRQLRNILEQCSDVSPDLNNMIAKADEALSPRDPQRPMVGMVGATGTGTFADFPWADRVLTKDREKFCTQRGHRHSLPV